MFKQQRRRRYEVPKNFPTAVTFRLGNSQDIDLPVLDLEAHNAFRRNVSQLDPGKITARKQELGETPFSADDFARSLKDGAEFRGELAPDGGTVTCGSCLQTFQPLLIPWTNRETGEKGEGGNFLILKKVQINDLTEKLMKKALAERVALIAEETTKAVMGDGYDSLLGRAVAFPVCRDCREMRKRKGFMERYFSRASALEKLPTVDQKIEVAANRAVISEALGGRQFRRPVGGGVGTERSRGGSGRRFERREDTRPRRQWPGPGGAELLTETANALDKAKYASLEDALAAAKSGKLLEQGIVPSPNALAAVTKILSYAFQGQLQAVGDQQPSIVAPGASRPQFRRPTKSSRPRVVINADPDSGPDSGKKTRRRNTGGTSPSEALA